MRLTSRLLLVFWFFVPLHFQGQDAPEAERATTEQLMREAAEVLKLAQTDNIQAAKQSGLVFNYAERLKQEKAYSDALSFFEQALRLSPWSVDRYMSYVATLKELKFDERAERWARTALDRAEDTPTREEARKWLGEKAEERLPEWEGKVSDRAICLVAIGSPPEWLVHRCGHGLQNILGIPVFVLKEKIALPKSHRSSFQRWVTSLRASVQWDNPEVRMFLREKGLPINDLTDRQVLTAMEALIGASRPPEELENFRRLKIQMGSQRYDQQWDATKLWEILAENAKRENDRNPIWLGVTDVDIFGGDTNFIFGMASGPPDCAVVSCARFSADFNGEPPDSNRLSKRLLKQMLSSIGTLLGAQRPIDPTCPRSYPQSLAEHDAKTLNLCGDCRGSIAKSIHKSLPALPTDVFGPAKAKK